MLLAFDDTDGPEGGCTTHAALHVLAALPSLALIGLPRLIRLNPNVPWKTRGNGAVALPLGHPEGPQVRVGEVQGMEILAFPEGRPAQPDNKLLDHVWAKLQALAQPGSQPAVAWAAEPLHASGYQQAVTTLVDPDEAKILLDAESVLHRESLGGRALAGCLGALAWPGPPTSYEFIAYRQARHWGTPRRVDGSPLAGLDASGVTFHTWDPEAGRPVCVPKGPDPVLLGLRGRDPDALRETALHAVGRAALEPVDAWLFWATNQASGDHVVPLRSVADAPPLATVQVRCTVMAAAATKAGGHVVVELEDGAGCLVRAMAFEPTHGLRDIVRQLRPGDEVVVVGAYASGQVNLEKLQVVKVAEQLHLTNPTCSCGRAMRSKGPSTGFRCPACGAKAPRSAAVPVKEPRDVVEGWHEVPVMARRHLHRPLAWSQGGLRVAARGARQTSQG